MCYYDKNKQHAKNNKNNKLTNASLIMCQLEKREKEFYYLHKNEKINVYKYC